MAFPTSVKVCVTHPITQPSALSPIYPQAGEPILARFSSLSRSWWRHNRIEPQVVGSKSYWQKVDYCRELETICSSTREVFGKRGAEIRSENVFAVQSRLDWLMAKRPLDLALLFFSLSVSLSDPAHPTTTTTTNFLQRYECSIFSLVCLQPLDVNEINGQIDTVRP